MAIVKISDLPLVDSPVEGTDLFVVVQDNVTKKAYASDIQTYVGFEEVQTATAGQTVFNLTTMTYAAGANNLMVFVDGVNQYEGSSYVETDNNTVTFTQGLHQGALVKFSTVQTQTSSVANAGAVTFLQAGTGAVPRSVQSKERDLVSVKDFGAQGDGVTDDTAAIQAGINSGKPLFFPPGTYIVTLAQTINLEGGLTTCALIAQSNMVLQGSGWGHSIIKLKDGESTDASPKYFNIIATNTHVDNIVIDGLCFDINGQNNKISPNRGSNVYNKFNCAAFIASGSTPIVGQDAYVTNSRFTNNLFKNSPGVTVIGLAQTNTPGTTLGFNVQICNNIFYNNGIDTDDHSSVYAWAENVLIDGNTFYAPTMSTGRQGPLVACELHGARNTFTNNSVYNYPQGLWVASNTTNTAYHINISNNTFVVSSYGMLFFKESAAETPIWDVVIANNNLWITDDAKTPMLAGPKTGIGVSASLGDTRFVVITGNNIRTDDTTQATAISALALGSGTSIDEITISNNQLEGFATNIGLGVTGGGSFGQVVVDGNSILTVTPNSTSPTITYGIYYEGANDTLSITNNFISGASGNLYSGIILNAGSTLDNLVMSGNEVNNPVNVAINDGVTVSGRRYGEQARTFSSLPAQSSWILGDYAYNGAPGETGSPGSKYIVTKWFRATTGTGNVLNTDWLECRSLTGN